jgi:hypothetical protein
VRNGDVTQREQCSLGGIRSSDLHSAVTIGYNYAMSISGLLKEWILKVLMPINQSNNTFCLSAPICVGLGDKHSHLSQIEACGLIRKLGQGCIKKKPQTACFCVPNIHSPKP